MGARAGTGVEIELDKVPQREAAMTAYEIMLSESQERMLLVAEKSKEKEVFEVFHKWGLDAAAIGHVTADGLLRVRHHGELAAEIPNRALADEGPVYQRPLEAPEPPSPSPIAVYSFLDGCEPARIQEFLEGADANALLRLAAASPNLCSRRWVWEQYDHMVQSNTMVGPGSDAAVIRLKGAGKALAMTLDGPAFQVARNPREGAKLMVAEACRNIVCSGGRPLAATNCLNFGNPEHPEVMWQFSEVVDGMSEACQVFGTPITGGNVSFYNETFEKDIYPTPVLGMVGIIENLGHVTTADFKDSGDAIVLLETPARLTGQVRLDEELLLQRFVADAIHAGLVKSAHDVSEGGLSIALAECCYSTLHRPAIGAAVSIPAHADFRMDLFGEYCSRILLTTTHASDLVRRAGKSGLRCQEIGRVGGQRLTIQRGGQPGIDVDIVELEGVWRLTLPKLLS
jgi:phosphoribosylformylglycinamidine synthase